MSQTRPLSPIAPLQFGRRRTIAVDPTESVPESAGDLRLFATTFAAGFVFVSLLIA